jgi:hypothetical protein
LRKARDERDTINNVLLVQARAKCEEAGESFEKFRKQYCPDLSRSRLYVVLAIADGRKTVEQDRAEKRESVAKSRAKVVSSTSAVGDTPRVPTVATPNGTTLDTSGFSAKSKITGNDVDTEASAEARKAAASEPEPCDTGADVSAPDDVIANHITTSAINQKPRAIVTGERVVGRRSVRLQEGLRPIPPGHDRGRGSQKGPRVLHDRLRQSRQESSHEGGVSVEFTPTTMVRERTVWLTDHQGATVEDFDRLADHSTLCTAASIAASTKLIWTGSKTMTKYRPSPRVPS